MNNTSQQIPYLKSPSRGGGFWGWSGMLHTEVLASSVWGI